MNSQVSVVLIRHSRFASLLSLAVVLTLATVSSWAEPAEAPEFVPRDSRKGTELPDFYRYQALFQFAHESLADPDEEFRTFYLEKIVGIPAGEGQEIFEGAVAEAWELLTNGQQPQVTIRRSKDESSTAIETVGGGSGPDRSHFPSDREFDAEIRRGEREKARALGRILGELERSLEEAGVSTAGLHSYADDRLAERTTLTTDREITPDHHLWEVGRAFDLGRQAGYRGVRR